MSFLNNKSSSFPSNGPCGPSDERQRSRYDGLIKTNPDCPSSTIYSLRPKLLKIPGSGKRSAFGPNGPLESLENEESQQRREDRHRHDSFIDTPSALRAIQPDTTDPPPRVLPFFSRLPPSTPQRTLSARNGLSFPDQQQTTPPPTLASFLPFSPIIGKMASLDFKSTIRSPPRTISHSPGSSFSVVKKHNVTNSNEAKPWQDNSPPKLCPQHLLTPMTRQDPSHTHRQVPLIVLSSLEKSCLTPQYPTHDRLEEKQSLPYFIDRYTARHPIMPNFSPRRKMQSAHLSHDDLSLLFLQPPRRRSSSICGGSVAGSCMLDDEREDDTNVRGRPGPPHDAINNDEVTKSSWKSFRQNKVPMEIFVHDSMNDCKPSSFNGTDLCYNQCNDSILSMDSRGELQLFTDISNYDNLSALTGDSDDADDDDFFFLSHPKDIRYTDKSRQNSATTVPESSKTNFSPYYYIPQSRQNQNYQFVPNLPFEPGQKDRMPARKSQKTLSKNVPSLPGTTICSCNRSKNALSACDNCNLCFKIGFEKLLPGQRQEINRRQDSQFTFESSTFPSSSSLFGETIDYQSKCGSVILNHATFDSSMNEYAVTGDIISTPPVTMREIENPPPMNKNR